MSVANFQNKKLIFLTGFMGSGKTTIGQFLSKKLNKKFYDLDQEVEKFIGQNISTIIEKFGEEYFRKMENQRLALLCKEHDAVIALGGGSLILEKNQTQVMKSGLLVCLMAEEKTLMKRLEISHSRPLLKGEKSLLELYKERQPGYMKANFFICSDEFSPEELANRISHEIEKI